MAAPVNTVPPALSGTFQTGQTVTTGHGTWTDDGSPVYTYQWQQSNDGVTGWADIAGATATTLSLNATSYYNTYVRSRVTDTDSGGATTANSAAARVNAAFPITPTPAYYGQCDWTTAVAVRNGVFYDGETPVVTLTKASATYGPTGYEVRDPFGEVVSSGVLSFSDLPYGADFEDGVNGNQLKITDDWGDQTTPQSILGSSNCTYSSAQKYTGSLSMKCVVGHDGIVWSLNNLTDHYGRMYLYVDTDTANTVQIVQAMHGGSIAGALSFSHSSGRRILVGLQGNTGLVVGTKAITVGTWVRVEWHIHHDPSAGFVEAKLFLTPGSASPDETIVTALGNTLAFADSIQIGKPNGTADGVLYEDDILAAVQGGYPGTATPPILNRTVLGITPDAPVDGWPFGWYRFYATGPTDDRMFGSAVAGTNFCYVPASGHFPTMPAASVAGTAGQSEDPDYVMKGVMGCGTQRIQIDNANAPTTGSNTLAKAASDAALSTTYWANPGVGMTDSERPRYLFASFPNGTVDQLAISGSVSGVYGYAYCEDETIDGSQVFVQVSAGTNPSTDKIRVYFPNNSTLVETYDNLASNQAAQTAINGVSAYIKFFYWGSARAAVTAVTAIGNAYDTGVQSVVSTLYAAGVTRFEGPINEPLLQDFSGGERYAHEMRLFQASVQGGNGAALAIGPCPVQIDSWGTFFSAGGGAFCDEISFHAYNSQTQGNIVLGQHQWSVFTALLATNGLSSKPLWQTESTGVFNSVYRLYHPRRSRVPISQVIQMEQYGLRREQNSCWYDVSHGFWNFPYWLEHGDGSLNPHAALIYTLAIQTWGRPFLSALDFGTPGNSILLGSLYGLSDGDDRTLVVIPTCCIADYSVTFTTSAGSLEMTDGFGNTSLLTTDGDGRIVVPLTNEFPVYLDVPAGETIELFTINDWPEIGVNGQGNPSSPLVSSIVVAASTIVGYQNNQTRIMVDNHWEPVYDGSSAGVYLDLVNLPPTTITMLWENAARVDRVLIWNGQDWQPYGVFLDFDVQTSDDGVTWVTQQTVTRTDSTSFLFGSDSTGTGCNIETYDSEQWFYDVKFDAPVATKGIRLNIRETSNGGEPADWDPTLAGGQGGIPRISVQEIMCLCDDNVIPRYATVS